MGLASARIILRNPREPDLAAVEADAIADDLGGDEAETHDEDGSEAPTLYSAPMANRSSKLSEWTPEQIALGRRWVEAWKDAGPMLGRLRRDELRRLEGHQAIALLCGSADYRVPPRRSRRRDCSSSNAGSKGPALVIRAAAELQALCVANSWRFCFIGGSPSCAGANHARRRAWT